VFLAALIGEVMAMATAEVSAARWKVKLGHPPVAGSATDYQRTDKPVSLPPVVAGGAHQFNLIVHAFSPVGLVWVYWSRR
jgi:hypothetical protein